MRHGDGGIPGFEQLRVLVDVVDIMVVEDTLPLGQFALDRGQGTHAFAAV